MENGKENRQRELGYITGGGRGGSVVTQALALELELTKYWYN
jgi:hypothetical protein